MRRYQINFINHSKIAKLTDWEISILIFYFLQIMLRIRMLFYLSISANIKIYSYDNRQTGMFIEVEGRIRNC